MKLLVTSVLAAVSCRARQLRWLVDPGRSALERAGAAGVKSMVGSANKQIYLPAKLAERLGYLKERAQARLRQRLPTNAQSATIASPSAGDLYAASRDDYPATPAR